MPQIMIYSDTLPSKIEEILDSLNFQSYKQKSLIGTKRYLDDRNIRARVLSRKDFGFFNKWAANSNKSEIIYEDSNFLSKRNNEFNDLSKNLYRKIISHLRNPLVYGIEGKIEGI